MTKNEFRQFIDNGPIILDGATGTNLMDAGMPIGVCPEAWILEHKEVLLKLQREYVEAGTNIVYAPTFTGNRIKNCARAPGTANPRRPLGAKQSL